MGPPDVAGPAVAFARTGIAHVERRATYAGCPIFPAEDWYNRDVSHAPIAPGSAMQIAITNAAAREQHFVYSIGIERINLATSATPTYAVTVPAGAPRGYYHAEHFRNRRFPWQDGFYIEGGSRAGGAGGDDNHALVVDTDACRLYETYWTSWSDGRLGAYSGAVWDLRRPFVGVAPSAMASGLSLFAGAIRWDDDLATGSIDHALNFFVPQGSNGPGISPPAVASGSNGPAGIAYGAHLRLHADFPEAGTPQTIAVIRALKRYGMFLADTSSRGGEVGFYTIAPRDGNDAHFDFGGPAPFALSDFDVVAATTPARAPCARSRHVADCAGRRRRNRTRSSAKTCWARDSAVRHR